MPKQLFQRPSPIKHAKMGKPGGPPGGAQDWGRKKGPKPSKAVKPSPTKDGSENK